MVISVDLYAVNIYFYVCTLYSLLITIYVITASTTAVFFTHRCFVCEITYFFMLSTLEHEC